MSALRTVLLAYAAAGCLSVVAEQLVFEYDRPDTKPVIFSAESRAENASAADYCLWLDVHYTDGSATWGMGMRALRAVRERTAGKRRPAYSVRKSR